MITNAMHGFNYSIFQVIQQNKTIHAKIEHFYCMNISLSVHDSINYRNNRVHHKIQQRNMGRENCVARCQPTACVHLQKSCSNQGQHPV
jgi:hypothetical protein